MALVYLLASDDAELVGVASPAATWTSTVCRNNLGLLQLCAAGTSRCRAGLSAAGRPDAHRRDTTASRSGYAGALGDGS